MGKKGWPRSTRTIDKISMTMTHRVDFSRAGPNEPTISMKLMKMKRRDLHRLVIRGVRERVDRVDHVDRINADGLVQ